ncbi:hypothetical protein HD598_001509 [Neomicrococcus aestuarii]|uniref:Uncharacterized protein n=1 Tax=Neomicrococcus aestuarii TaxID=556325 RepID=A0A7W8TTV1_9MICC|nr:hypothetical protein [Neomicrococcus aestuarii]MBB5512822.1 hypothetical protein [Neomicrococcus aestuarii]
MAQQFNVGTVLGGRYRVTERVLISNDDDHVLRGFDQVLDRPVSILVAAPVNAAQAATSAREIATGERIGNVQILDLGLSDGRTYLITNIAESADLLDLVIEAPKNTPYIEPFMTDTLGSEIFGEARAFEPHVYEDDDEYYHELAQQGNRPTNPGIQQRLNDLRSRFGRSKDAENDDAAAYEQSRPAVEEYIPEEPEVPRTAARPQSTAPSSQETSRTSAGAAVAGAAGVAAAGLAGAGAASAGAAETTGAAAAASSSAPRRGTRFSTPPPRPDHEPKVTPLTEDDDDAASVSDTRSAESVAPSRSTQASAAAAPAVAAAAASSTTSSAAPKATSAPEYAQDESVQDDSLQDDSDEQWDDSENDYQSNAGYYDDDDDDDDVDRDKETRTRRLIIGALLGLVLIVAVVFAFQALIPRGGSVAANSSSANSSGAATSSAASSAAQSTQATAAPAEIVGLSRQVPSNQELNSDRDSILPLAIDGSEGTLYRTYSFSSAEFGGFANSMALVVELQEATTVSELQLAGMNATGGAFEILVGESEDLADATEVAQGSFTGPTMTVPLSTSEADATKVQYVFINITELPRQAAPASPERPFGFQLSEITVK